MQCQSFSKSRRRRQRERYQTNDLMSRTIALHVRFESLYICKTATWNDKVIGILENVNPLTTEAKFFVFSFGIKRCHYIFSTSMILDRYVSWKDLYVVQLSKEKYKSIFYKAFS